MNLLVVFQPTPFCNLNCSYCWAPDRQDPRRMSMETVRSTFRQVAEGANLDRVDLCWLTGEPMTMGLDFYRRSLAEYREVIPSRLQGRFVVQTNGTLINEEWARFFAEEGFTVGVSIDGPKIIHDAQRLNWSGRSMFDKTMAGIELLERHGVRGGALCVITPETLKHPPEALFEFFQERGISWSYLIGAEIGANKGAGNAFTLADKAQLTTYLGRLIDLWGQAPSSYVRDFDQLSRRMFGDFVEGEDVDNLGCLDIVNITHDGDFFWGNPELMAATAGPLSDIRSNITETTIWKFREHAAFKRFKAETHLGVRMCQESCAHFGHCLGGNPAHKFYEHGRCDVAAHTTCQLNDQVIATLLLDKLRQAA